MDTSQQVRLWQERMKGGGGRRYPDELVVKWYYRHAQNSVEPKRVLDLGCGSGSSNQLFMDDGFTYHGIDVTDAQFPDAEVLENMGWQDRCTFQTFMPPKIDASDEYFSHVISTEALHCNASIDSMQAMLAEVHRVLAPGGRFFANCFTPQCVFANQWSQPVAPHVIRIDDQCPQKGRIGIEYFIFSSEEHIQEMFTGFSECFIGRNDITFGEDPELALSWWIISATR